MSKSEESSEKSERPSRRTKVAATVAGVAAIATAAGVAVARSRSRGRRTTVHVRPGAGGWQVTATGEKAPVGSFEVKSEAVQAGRDAARRRAPSELVIHRADGSEQDRHHYDD